MKRIKLAYLSLSIVFSSTAFSMNFQSPQSLSQNAEFVLESLPQWFLQISDPAAKDIIEDIRVCLMNDDGTTCFEAKEIIEQARDQDGNSLLHLIVKSGDIDSVKKGAKLLSFLVNAQNNLGNTPLHNIMLCKGWKKWSKEQRLFEINFRKGAIDVLIQNDIDAGLKNNKQMTALEIKPSLKVLRDYLQEAISQKKVKEPEKPVISGQISSLAFNVPYAPNVNSFEDFNRRVSEELGPIGGATIDIGAGINPNINIGSGLDFLSQPPINYGVKPQSKDPSIHELAGYRDYDKIKDLLNRGVYLPENDMRLLLEAIDNHKALEDIAAILADKYSLSESIQMYIFSRFEAAPVALAINEDDLETAISSGDLRQLTQKLNDGAAITDDQALFLFACIEDGAFVDLLALLSKKNPLSDKLKEAAQERLHNYIITVNPPIIEEEPIIIETSSEESKISLLGLLKAGMITEVLVDLLQKNRCTIATGEIEEVYTLAAELEDNEELLSLIQELAFDTPN